MLSTQTGQLVVRGLAPLRSDRLVGYSVRYSFIVADFHRLLLAGLTGALCFLLFVTPNPHCKADTMRQPGLGKLAWFAGHPRGLGLLIQ